MGALTQGLRLYPFGLPVFCWYSGTINHGGKSPGLEAKARALDSALICHISLGLLLLVSVSPAEKWERNWLN